MVIATEIEPEAIVRSLGMEATTGCRRVERGWATAICRFKTADGENHSLRVFNPEPDQIAKPEGAATRRGLSSVQALVAFAI